MAPSPAVVVGLDAAFLENTPPNQRPTDVVFLDLDKGELLQPGEYGAVPPPSTFRADARLGLDQTRKDGVATVLEPPMA